MSAIHYKLNINPDIRKYQPRIFEGAPDFEPGTSLYEEYWQQERERCIHGYKPKGMTRITGKHYFFLNYWKIKVNDPTVSAADDRKILALPFFRDMDKIYFDAIDECKQDRIGLIVAKARDKGFSMFNSCAAGHEATFFPHNEIGIAAGLDKTIQSLAMKVKIGQAALPNEFRNNILLENDEILYYGYEWNNKGRWEKGGMQSMIHLRTMGANANVFKGERMALMIFEEAGEFRKLIEGFRASEPCFRDGKDQFGLPIVGGTGGNILNASADFKNMWYEHENYSLRQLFIPVTMCYKGFFDFTNGRSIIEGAKQHELNHRKKLEKGDAKSYNLYVQNFPFTPEESFLKATGSPFNLMKINEQIARVRVNKNTDYVIETGWLDWDEEIETVPGNQRMFNKRVFGEKVKWRKDPHGPIKILLHPIWKELEDGEKQPEYYNVDIGGIDSIDQDEAGASDSEGAVVIYRRFVSLNQPHNLPVATLKFRSNRSVEFYELALKMAIYYNCQMLVEYTKIDIIDYFKNNGGRRFLKEKPRTVHSPDTTTKNRYGVHMNKQIKSVGIGLMADDIDANCEDIWFEELLMDFADFGERNTDLAMAYMMCQIHNFDIAKVRVIKQEELFSEDDGYDFGRWEQDAEGNLKLVSGLQKKDELDLNNKTLSYNEIRKKRQVQQR